MHEYHEEHHHHHHDSQNGEVYYDRHGKAHRRRKFGHSEYRHHHHHHRRTWKKVLWIVLAVLLIAVCAAVVSWRVLDAMGKNSLYKKNGEQVPTLAEEAQNEGAGEETADSQEVWKDGWIRYQDKVYEYNDEIITFLVMGVDDMNYVSAKSGGINGGQADSLFLLVLNPKTQKISVVAINRNTMTEIDVYDANGDFDHTGVGQICLAHGYGNGMEESCEREEKAVSNLLYSLPMSGYIAINMGAIPMINDAVGGVTVPRMTYQDGKIEYGKDQTLMGMDAFRYVHNRGDDFDAASYRLEKQKVYLKALMKKMMDAVRENPTSIVNLYQTISPYMVTDVDLSEVTYLAGQMGNYSLDLDTIYSLQGETKMGDQGFEEFYYDEDALYEMMLQVFYTEVPEEERTQAAG